VLIRQPFAHACDNRHMSRTSRIALPVLALVAGLVLLPTAAYVWGGRLAGPYAGPRGLASYLGSLYGDAGQGRLLAWLVLAGPPLAIAVWPLRSWLLRRWRAPATRG
jgi:hypothetical protein